MIRQQLPFTVVSKPTGAACNLDCSYCFFLSKELLYDHDRQMMTEETQEASSASTWPRSPTATSP